MTEVRQPVMRDSATAGDLLALIRSGRASTRTDLRALTGLSRTAVVSRVNALVDIGFLRDGIELASTGGRPPGSLELDTSAGSVLAVAVGRSRSQVAVFDLGGRELASSAVDHEVAAGPDEVMPIVATQLRRLITRSTPPVLGIGMSLPGVVEDGMSIGSPVIGGWDHVPLAPYLMEVADVPFFLANDADVMARSELLGHAADRPDVLVLKASTGLGMGVIADGRIVSGALGGAGDLGHTKVAEATGRPCRCGDVGCLEAVAGGWALVARLREEGRAVEHVRDLVALAQGGDPEAKLMLRESGRRVGELLAVAINLLNPGAVVLGGDMAGAYDVYAAGVRESVYARASAFATRELRFLPATYGDRAGLVGCAALALDGVLSPAVVDARLAARRPAALI